MLENEIKELILVCQDTKPQALGLPPYHQASEWATGSNPIATYTLYDKAESTEQEFPLDTAGVEIKAMRKWNCNGAEPASTLHPHAALIKERRRTSAATKTVGRYCNTGGKHRSHESPQKTAIGNHIKVDNQQAFDPVTKNLGMLQEPQDLPIIG